jgi:two-component system response regulator
MEPGSSLPDVVIIDDDEADRMLAQRALRRIGIPNAIRVFGSGKEFMDFMRAAMDERDPEDRIPICVVFLDLKMPPPDGFDMLRWIRAQAALSHVQIVVLTGSVDPKDMRVAAELQADLYLPKFPSDETLARVVAKASESAQAAIRYANLR